MRVLDICVVWSAVFVLTQSEIYIYKTGWLDRVVEYFKQKFIADVQNKLPPIGFKAEIVKAPPGYVDSDKWDYDSVVRLLKLIHSNGKTRPLARALRRTLNPMQSRRIFMSKQKSYYKFPKYPADVDVFYGDSDYEADVPEDKDAKSHEDGLDDETILVLSNPVEARLPSAHISVGMLKQILKARAKAARVMPGTTKSTIPWKPMSTKKSSEKKKVSTSKSDDKVAVANGIDDKNGSNNNTGDGKAKKPGNDTSGVEPGNKTSEDKLENNDNSTEPKNETISDNSTGDGNETQSNGTQSNAIQSNGTQSNDTE